MKLINAFMKHHFIVQLIAKMLKSSKIDITNDKIDINITQISKIIIFIKLKIQ